MDRVRIGADRFTHQPGALQLALAASVVLILGTLLPWDSTGPNGQAVDAKIGQTSLVIGVVAIILIARLITTGGGSDSGGLAGLGLLAAALLGVELIRAWDDGVPLTLDVGLYLSAGAAVVLLVSGILLLGADEGMPDQRSPDESHPGD